jgi:hypothetical protein
VNQVGFMPIPWTEIQAWAELSRLRPKMWEIEILVGLDDLWLSIQNKKNVTLDDLKGNDTPNA